MLHSLCEVDTSDECTVQSVGDNPCGFCGLNDCLPQLLEKKGGGFTITPNCPYHYVQMQYQAAAQFSKSSPCTNVLIHCPICPTSVSDVPQTIWKYNALFHLASEHGVSLLLTTVQSLIPFIDIPILFSLFSLHWLQLTSVITATPNNNLIILFCVSF